MWNHSHESLQNGLPPLPFLLQYCSPASWGVPHSPTFTLSPQSDLLSSSLQLCDTTAFKPSISVTPEERKYRCQYNFILATTYWKTSAYMQESVKWGLGMHKAFLFTCLDIFDGKNVAPHNCHLRFWMHSFMLSLWSYKRKLKESFILLTLSNDCDVVRIIQGIKQGDYFQNPGVPWSKQVWTIALE